MTPPPQPNLGNVLLSGTSRFHLHHVPRAQKPANASLWLFGAGVTVTGSLLGHPDDSGDLHNIHH